MKVSEIKKEARLSLKGDFWRFALTTLIYFIIVMFLSYILEAIGVKLKNYTVPLTFIQAIFALVSSALSYGLISNILDISNKKTKSATNFIDKTFLNFTKYVKIVFRIFLRVLIPLIIFLLCVLYFVGTDLAYENKTNFLCFNYNLVPLAAILCLVSFGFFVYFALKYIPSAYVFYNHPEMNSKEVVDKSSELMKGKKLEYITLMLPFLCYVIILAVILFILNKVFNTIWLLPFIVVFYTLLRPYVIMSESIFFEDLESENTSEINNAK